MVKTSLNYSAIRRLQCSFILLNLVLADQINLTHEQLVIKL